jgi:hypothetical protein
MVIVLTLFVLMTIASFGVLYFQTSGNRLNESYTEAQRIKARALASAGLNKALILIRDRYKRAFYSWRYPEQGENVIGRSEFSGELGAGTWEIELIESYYLDSPEGSVGPYTDVPYVLYGNRKGSYDILKIRARGRMKESKITASVTGLVKIIRQECQY